MNKILNNGVLKNIFLFALVACVVCVAGDAMAASGDDIFNRAVSKLGNTFNGARKVAFMVGAFALLAMAFLAFLGKMKWMWVAYLGIGLGFLALAGSIIGYLSTDQQVDAGVSAPDDLWN